MENEKRLQILIEYLSSLSYIKTESIPDIDLYMDQVLGFMDEHLSKIKRYSDDKALTKTMINNYAKNNLLPPPVRKKYSKEHILMLLFIYYYKGVLTLTDIETLLTPLNERFFPVREGLTLEDIYNEIFSMEAHQLKELAADVRRKYDLAQETFDAQSEKSKELSDADRSYLQLFAFLCELGFDVYLKKQLMEKIIDQLRTEQPQPKKKK